MNIEIIGKDRIKVVLSEAEMEERNLTNDVLVNKSELLNSFLFEIMEEIREKTEFNPYNGQVVVEAIRGSEGLMLIISKANREKKKLTAADKEKIRRAKPVVKKKETQRQIYIFDDFENLCSAVIRLGEGSFEKSSVYRIGKVFYFYLEQDEGFLKSSAVLSEYCSQKASADMIFYVEEHSDLMFNGSELKKMSVKLR